MKNITLVDGGNIGYKSFFKSTEIDQLYFDESSAQSYVYSYLESMIKNSVGKIILALDSPNWRKDIYPEYKGKRTKPELMKTESYIKFINEFQKDLLKLPIVPIKIDKCEADDIISIIVLFTEGNFKIISNDKDFWQLTLYKSNIVQFSPISELYTNDKYNLREHIMIGDTSDNIEPVFKGFGISRLDKMLNCPFFEDEIKLDDKAYKRFLFNKMMIDFREIPKEIKDIILDKYNSFIITSNLESISDFCNKYNIDDYLYTKLLGLL